VTFHHDRDGILTRVLTCGLNCYTISARLVSSYAISLMQIKDFYGLNLIRKPVLSFEEMGHGQFWFCPYCTLLESRFKRKKTCLNRQMKDVAPVILEIFA
jgi:hypothetical protein